MSSEDNASPICDKHTHIQLLIWKVGNLRLIKVRRVHTERDRKANESKSVRYGKFPTQEFMHEGKQNDCLVELKKTGDTDGKIEKSFDSYRVQLFALVPPSSTKGVVMLFIYAR